MYNLKDLMQMFDMPERTIRRHIKNGLLKGIKIGRSWRFSEDDIVNFIGKSRVSGTIEKNAVQKVIAHMHGFCEAENQIVSIVHKKGLKKKMRKLLDFVNTFEKKIFFHANQRKDRSVITFIACQEDTLQFIRELDNL